MIVNEALKVAESPEKSPELNDSAFSNGGSIILRAFFDDTVSL